MDEYITPSPQGTITLQVGTLVTPKPSTHRYDHLRPDKYIYTSDTSPTYWTRKDRAPLPEICLNPYNTQSCPHEIITYINTIYSQKYTTFDPDDILATHHDSSLLKDLAKWEKMPYGNIVLYPDINENVGKAIPVQKYEQSQMSQTWQWMVWPSAYIDLDTKRKQPGTRGSATVQRLPTDMDSEYEIYKLQFRQILTAPRTRVTLWKMITTTLQTQVDKDGNHTTQIIWDDSKQPKDEDTHWCTAAVFTRTTNTNTLQLQKSLQTLQTTLRTHINMHSTTKIQSLQAHQKAIEGHIQTMTDNIASEQNARITQDRLLTTNIQQIERNLAALQRRPTPPPTSNMADTDTLKHNLELKFTTLLDAINTISEKQTDDDRRISDLQKTCTDLKTITHQNSNHRQNYEPWLDRLLHSKLNQTNWTHVYQTTDAIMTKVTEIAHKYNEYMDSHDRDHPHHRSALDVLSDIFSIFSSTLSAGKTIKNLTLDEYNSVIKDVADATTAIKNVTGSIRDVTQTVHTMHTTVNNILSQWTTEKQTFKDTVSQMTTFETDGRTEIENIRQQVQQFVQDQPQPKMCLRKNDILP